jgi:tRNA1(Val) A37 N6-methylase TrmN6
MVNSIKLKNVNQAFSLTKANLTVLEDDIKKTFSSHEKTSFDYTEYN